MKTRGPAASCLSRSINFSARRSIKPKSAGFVSGRPCWAKPKKPGVEVILNATVMGIFSGKEVTVMIGDHIEHYKGDNIVVATGASENMVPFEGWTLPGVIGAGAAQTMMNLHGVRPGSRILMVGSGNVGLVVSFQLMQAGCEVVAVIDAAPRVGGYGVHAAKVARTGVPFFLSHTVVRAEGEDHVTGVILGEVGSDWQVVPGSERYLDVDTICMAVGLSPMSQLARIAGCEMTDDPKKGGLVPVCGADGQTSVPGIFLRGRRRGYRRGKQRHDPGPGSGRRCRQKKRIYKRCGIHR